MILSVFCLKLFRDALHSQTKTHAPSMVFKVLCDLLPPVFVTLRPPPTGPLPLLKQASSVPAEAMVPRGLSQDHSTWLLAPKTVAVCIKVTIPGRPHQHCFCPTHQSGIFTVSISSLSLSCSSALLDTIPEGEFQEGRGFTPSTSTVSGTQKASNTCE